MSDYGASTPLWTGGPISGKYNVAYGPLRLQAALLARLAAWQKHFEEHFEPFRTPHWDSVEAPAWYAVEGKLLQIALAEALPGATVVLDLWPVPQGADGAS